MRTHSLKTWPKEFSAVIGEEKKFEFRREDGDRPPFEIGDAIWLQEFRPCETCGGCGRVWDNGDRVECGSCYKDGKNSKGEFTGREALVTVTYIVRGPSFGIPVGYCVMSIKLDTVTFHETHPSNQNA